jgi:uncharacterized protein YcbX
VDTFHSLQKKRLKKPVIKHDKITLNKSRATQPMPNLTISSLNIYPVKSLKGISLARMPLSKRGPIFDREWMIVDSKGKFITQRENAKMALIACDLTEWEDIDRIETATVLTLTLPDGETIDIPLDSNDTPTDEPIAVQVWKDTCFADLEPRATGQLSDFFGAEVRLVRMRSDFKRIVDPDYCVDGNETVGFADAHPLMLISDNSLVELNNRLEIPVEMNRFRPNITISGAEAFAEDNWQILSKEDIDIHMVKPCARCVITTIDQDTADTGKEPLRTLSTFRKIDGKIIFGQDACHKFTGDLAELNVGDTLSPKNRTPG